MPNKDNDGVEFGNWPAARDPVAQPEAAQVRTDELAAMLTAHFDKLAQEPLPQNLLDLLGRLEAKNSSPKND